MGRRERTPTLLPSGLLAAGLFLGGGGTIFFTTHTHTDQRQNYSSVLIHLAAGKVTSAGGSGGYSREAQPEGGPHHGSGEASIWDAAQCVGGIGARRSWAASVV
jgi:hypothetical protein